MEETSKEVFKYMVVVGFICNILTLFVSIFAKDLILFSATISLCSLSAISYFIAFYKNLSFGVHTFLLSYIIVFTLASLTHLVSYPLMLVYPIVFGMTILVVKTDRARIIYAVLCAVACLFTIFFQQRLIIESSIMDTLSSLVIGFSLLLAFFTLSIFHLRLLNRYQDDLIDIQDGLEEKNIELERYIDSNLQLENFAHLASHELKTPIKNIANFSGLLKMKLNKRLANDEQEILDHINREVNNMNNLISDLLDLAQATNEKLTFTKFSSQDFFRNLINKNFKDYKQHIFLNVMPGKIMAHEKLLQQVFINLIGNAIKFRDTKNTLSIKIGVKEDKKKYHFSIDDNGIGIDKEARDKIFLIFKRLHSGAEYEGTGIGLAISKKIIERHGGSISVNSNEEGGTGFSFIFDKELMQSSLKHQAAKILSIRG